MHYTVNQLSNAKSGNHGHQLKNYFGARALGEVLNLSYVHTPYEYLDFFRPPRKFKIVDTDCYDEVVDITKTFWNGFSSFYMLNKTLRKLDGFAGFFNAPQDKKILFRFGSNFRVHPFQTIPWYRDGLIEKDVFSILTNEVSGSFHKEHINKRKTNDKMFVAIHMNFYHNTGLTSDYPRYRFSMEYYENAMSNIEMKFGKSKNVEYHIYSEQCGSKKIIERFNGKKNVFIHIGDSRESCNSLQIESIFKDFVDSDILVCSNSSFSVVASYYRNLKGKLTIYHPHMHLKNMPNDHFIAIGKLGKEAA
jgi:hypothetical protein